MNWFQKKSRRDQVALLLCGLILAASCMWALVLDPLRQTAAEAERRRLVAGENLATVKALAATLAQLRANVPAASSSQDSLATLVDRSTTKAGLALSAMEPGADGASLSLRLDDAQLPQTLRWLHELEQNHARMETLTLLPARKPGEVMVNVRLRRP